MLADDVCFQKKHYLAIGMWPKPPKDVLVKYLWGIFVVLHLFYVVLVLYVCRYFEKVWPNEFGTKLKWYFPFTKSYWCGPSAEDEFVADPKGCVHADRKKVVLSRFHLVYLSSVYVGDFMWLHERGSWSSVFRLRSRADATWVCKTIRYWFGRVLFVCDKTM